MAASRWKQLLTLLWKNWLFSLRNPVSTLAQLLLPMVFVLMLYLFGFLPSVLKDVPHPQPKPVGHLPKCQGWNGYGCRSLVVVTANAFTNFTPFTDNASIECVNQTITSFASDNDMSLGIDDNDEGADIWWNTTASAKDYFLSDSVAPNQTQAVLAFLKCSTESGSRGGLNYNIAYNASRPFAISSLYINSPGQPDGRNEIQVGIDRAFMSLYMGLHYNKSVDLLVETKDFPIVYQRQSRETLQNNNASLFLYCGITIQFIFLLYNIVTEKDLKLRQGLKIIGLKDSVYWLSWTLLGLFFALTSTFLLQATGYATQLLFFSNTDFYITFVIFLAYSISLIPLALFCSVFITTAWSAAVMGMVIFVVGVLLIMFLGNYFILEQFYFYLPLVPYALSFFPPFQLSKAMADIAQAASPTDTFGQRQETYRFSTEQFIMQRNVSVADLAAGTFHSFYMPATVLSVVWMMGDAVLYGLLAWYLDAVLPGNHGIPRKLYFFLTPSYWWKRGKRQRPAATPDGEPTEQSPLLNNIETTDRFPALHLVNLRKVFSKICSKAVKPAVAGLSLESRKNEILAILGHNGAGKSTVINMLTGLLAPSTGDAYLYNLSVRQDMDSIRNFLGVCPQHNVLWEDLTAKEHMQLFAHLKGIRRKQLKEDVRHLLECVQLDRVADNRVSTYSGGMKRRLSVALAFLGDPKVVFLDEPTTGMDPKIRRDIWNLILRMKGNRLIIMTTHSMEEADILGDSIAIMAHGDLSDLGSSNYLKNKYAGYTVEMVVRSAYQEEMTGIVAKMIPGAVLKSAPVEIEGGVLLQYRFPPESHSEITPFFKVLEAPDMKPDKVLDVSISQTTLEEVFLLVTAQHQGAE